MRKSLIAKQVEYFYDNLNLEVTEKSQGGNTYKVITNWFQISTSLYKLSEYDFIGDSIQNIFDLGASFQSSSKSISILHGEYPGFVTKFNIVKAKCEAIIDLYKLEEEDIENIYIKLPDSLNDLNTLSSMISSLDVAFNKCPILNKNIGNVSFKKVEEGSNWLVIAIGAAKAGAKALDWLANFVKSCNEIRLQNKTMKNIELDNILKLMEIEDKKQEQEYKKKVIKGEEEKIKSLCIEKFESIGMEYEEITPEDTSRIVHSMKTLADLIDMGIEIYPSTSCDIETKKLFPKQEELKLIEDSQKLLNEPEQENK